MSLAISRKRDLWFSNFNDNKKSQLLKLFDVQKVNLKVQVIFKSPFSSNWNWRRGGKIRKSLRQQKAGSQGTPKPLIGLWVHCFGHGGDCTFPLNRQSECKFALYHNTPVLNLVKENCAESWILGLTLWRSLFCMGLISSNWELMTEKMTVCGCLVPECERCQGPLWH